MHELKRRDFLKIGRLPAVAEHIGGERDITETGKPARALHREVAEPEPFVKDRDARPSSGNVLVKREIAAQTGFAAAVINVARLHEIPRFPE